MDDNSIHSAAARSVASLPVSPVSRPSVIVLLGFKHELLRVFLPLNFFYHCAPSLNVLHVLVRKTVLVHYSDSLFNAHKPFLHHVCPFSGARKAFNILLCFCQPFIELDLDLALLLRLYCGILSLNCGL